MRKALTFMELIITTALVAVLAIAMALMFRGILVSWGAQEARASIEIDLDKAMKEMARDLREATAVSSVNNDEVRLNNGGFAIYYLYNSADSYPPAFNQASYELRRATLTAINGTFTYGSGRLILTDVLPPATSDISLSSNLVNIDLSVKRKGETVRTRTQIIPRNI